jgi:O-antigen ligase
MRYLLATFFFVMYTGDNLGLNISLAPGVSVKNLLLYAIFSGIAINAAVARNRSFELPTLFIPFGLLIVYALITWIVASFILAYPDYEMRESFIRLKSSQVDQLLTFFIFFYGAMHLRDAYWLLRAIVWIAVLGNVVTLIDAFDIPNLGIVEAKVRNDRFLGFIGSANGYGQFLVLFLPATVAVYLTASRSVRPWAAVGVFATAIALILTGSRGAYVGLVAGSILAVIFLRKIISTQMIVRAGVITVFASAFVLAATLFTDYAEVYMESFAKFEGGTHIATSGRSTIWSNAIKAMVENPASFITGYGFNAYESSRRFYAATHNTYLNYLYNLGTIGLVLFMATFIALLTAARSVVLNASATLRPQFIAMIFGLFCFLISIFFSEYHQSTYLLWAYLGVTMRMAMGVREGTNVEAGETSAHRPSRSDGLVTQS